MFSFYYKDYQATKVQAPMMYVSYMYYVVGRNTDNSRSSNQKHLSTLQRRNLSSFSFPPFDTLFVWLHSHFLETQKWKVFFHSSGLKKQMRNGSYMNSRWIGCINITCVHFLQTPTYNFNGSLVDSTRLYTVVTVGRHVCNILLCSSTLEFKKHMWNASTGLGIVCTNYFSGYFTLSVAISFLFPPVSKSHPLTSFLFKDQDSTLYENECIVCQQYTARIVVL